MPAAGGRSGNQERFAGGAGVSLGSQGPRQQVGLGRVVRRQEGQRGGPV